MIVPFEAVLELVGVEGVVVEKLAPVPSFVGVGVDVPSDCIVEPAFIEFRMAKACQRHGELYRIQEGTYTSNLVGSK